MKKTILAFGILLIVAAVVWAGYATSNYTEQGGARTVVGGSIDVVSGGEMDIESGGALKIAGTAITSTAAELNKLDAGYQPEIETVITDLDNLATYGVTDANSAAAAFDANMPDVSAGLTGIGQTKLITMSTAGNNFDVSITHHETSDPEVARFDAADEYLFLVWTGTEWATVSNTCTFP